MIKMMDVKNLLRITLPDGTKKMIWRTLFTNRTSALEYANSGFCRITILGDDGLFWVVRLSDGEWLMRRGYEAAA